MRNRGAWFLAAMWLPAAALAQTLTGVTVQPAEVRAGETVNITVNFEVEGGINCGLRIHFGDGAMVDYRINQQKDVPLVVPRAYAKPGQYTIMAETKTQGTLMKCSGKNQTTTLQVLAPGAPPAKPAPQPQPAAAGPRCPAGWTLDAQTVNRASGAYTCRAASGTRAVKVACPGHLFYFESESRGMLGCRAWDR